jgi:chorismate mutase
MVFIKKENGKIHSKLKLNINNMDTNTITPHLDLQQLLKKRPLIISGPCSAETEEQVVQTAQLLANTGKVDLLRAGIWKPRTRPGSFEGIGTKGLPWLQTAKKVTGLPTAVEVATAKQVENSIHFDVDLLWIGARTTVNPFSVQEIADALKGANVPVFIKNPINTDIELWCGAVERIAKAGITQIGLIHRGFSSYGNTQYRNAPMWHLAIEMRRRFPELIIINDPSHIGGSRAMIQSIAQKAIDLNFDGLMIESHLDPDNAWSDAKQQVNPENFKAIIEALVWRQENTSEETFLTALEKLREQINHIDDELLQLLGQRMNIADQIGAFKKNNKVTILQTNRWNEIIERTVTKGENLGLGAEFVRSYLEAIHLESIRHQNIVMNNYVTKIE